MTVDTQSSLRIVSNDLFSTNSFQVLAELHQNFFDVQHHYFFTFYFSAAKQEMVKSKLPNNVLGKVWKLSDVDKDGMLDADEFALAMHLISIKIDGHDLPTELPVHLVPPSKRGF